MTNPTTCKHFECRRDYDGRMYSYCAVVGKEYPADKGRGCICDKYEQIKVVEPVNCDYKRMVFVNAPCIGGGYMTRG